VIGYNASCSAGSQMIQNWEEWLVDHVSVLTFGEVMTGEKD